MPTKRKTAIDLALTGLLFIGGAWLAAEAHDMTSVEDQHEEVEMGEDSDSE